MRHDNPKLQAGDGSASSFSIRGTTLLDQATLTSAQGDVVFDLIENVPGSDPVRKFNRYIVEIEDWSPTDNAVTPLLQLGVAGVLRSGASDYQFSTSVFPSNAGESNSFSDTSPDIKMTRIVGTLKAGNNPNETLNYTVTIIPGNDANTLPFVWFTGAGINDSGRLMGIKGFGVYRGTTSIDFGRTDHIRFAFESNTIAKGIFRLYGTE